MTILAEFFIPGKTAFVLKGDGRGFDPAPNPNQSRAFFSLNFGTGVGYFQVNPSCVAFGSRCDSALPINQGNNLIIYGSLESNSIMIQGSLGNSLTPFGRPRIDFGITFSLSGRGVSFSGYRDPFPALEITSSHGGPVYNYAENPAWYGGPLGLTPPYPDQPLSGYFPARGR